MVKVDKKEKRIIDLFIQDCGLLTIILGVSAILGWILDIPQLATFASGKIPMALSTAVLFAAYGLMIFFHNRLSSNRKMFWVEVAIGSTGLLAAILFLSLSLNGTRLDVEHLNIKMTGTFDGLVVGYMSPITAFCFVLVGLSFLMMLTKAGQKKLTKTSFILAVLVFLISIILLLSYLLGTPLLYEGSFIPPALPTSLTFLFIGIALLLLSGRKIWSYEDLSDVLSTRYTYILVLVFSMLIVTIMTAGYSYYKSYEKQFRWEIKNQLSSIASLKVNQIVQWRKERLEDAEIFYKNKAFSNLVMRFFQNKNDLEAEARIKSWIYNLQQSLVTDQVTLIDMDFNKKIIFPENEELNTSFLDQDTELKLRVGEIVFQDFYFDEKHKKIFLKIFVPILDEEQGKNLIGILALRIDPQQFLYPLIKEWPTPSKTAETLIVRREGNEVVFLNDLRFQKNTALHLRRPITEINLPAAHAALGKKEFIEGVDYRGISVFAYVCPIPNSPWFLVARIDTSEVYAPLQKWFWAIIILVAGLLIGSGASVGLVWRNQRSKFYDERYKSTENIRRLNRVYAVLSDINEAIVRIRKLQELFAKVCDIAVEKGGFQMAWIGKINSQTKKIDLVTSKGVTEVYLKKVDFNYEGDESQLGIAGRVIRTGTHVISNDIQNDENILPLHKESVIYGSKSFAAFPLKVFGQVWGVFKIYSREIGFFDEEELKLLDELAMDISFSIEFAEKEDERKRAKEALTYSETRYRRLFESAKDGILILDSETGKIVDVNPFLIDLLGYSKEKFIEKEVWEIGFFKDIVANYDKFLELQQKGYVRYEDLPLETSDGRKINVEFVSNVYSVNSHKVIQCNIRDITERKHAELKVRESEKRFREIIDQAPIAIALLDMQGRPVISNLYLSKMIGYSSDELSKMKFMEFTYPEDIDKDMKQFTDLIDGKISKYSMEKRYVHKNGSLIWVNLIVTMLRDENGIDMEIIGMAEDITERKRAQEKLIKSEEKYRSIFENVQDVFYETSIDGTILEVSPSIEILTKGEYLCDDLIGKSMYDFYSDPQERDTLIKELQKQKRLVDYEVKLKNRDGSIIPCSISSKIQFSTDGNPEKIIGTMHDITERKRTEEALRESEERFRKLYENAKIGLYRTTPDGKVLMANKLLVKLLGYPSFEMLAERNLEKNGFEQSYQRKDFLEKIEKDGEVNNYEAVWVRLDGSEVFVSESAHAIRDSNNAVVYIDGVVEDITERKYVEESLRESEERFRHSFDYAATGVCIVGTDGKFQKINNAFKEMIGYEENEIKNFTFSDITHPDDLSVGLSQLKKMLNGESDNTSFEKRYIRKDRRLIWVHVSISLVRNINHQPQFFITQIIDITDRKRSEEEIVMLAHSLKSINECVSITDMEDKILFVNESFLKTYGYDENELVGKNIRIVNSQKNSLEFMNKIRPATISGGWQGELWNKRKNGSEFLISLSTTMIKDKDGKYLGLIGVATDITERKKMEADIISAAEIAKLGYWEFDVDSGKFTFNDQYYRLIHGSSTQKQGGNIMSVEEFAKKLVYPDDATLVAKGLNEAISSLDPNYFGKAEARVFREDGNVANVSVQFKVLKDSSGRTYKVFGVNQDITESKRVEKELMEAKEKAEQSDKLKTEFLAQMSHEIRSPMNAVVSFANLLREDLEGKITPQLIEYLDGIDSAGHRLIRTVELILNASELQVGTFVPNFIDIDLIGEILGVINREYILLAQEKGLEFNFNSDVTKAIIHGDKYSIYQLFVNLMDNAVKYTNKGSISVKVEKNKNAPEEIKVTIEDTGIGMSEIFMERMYAQFTQEDQGYSRRYEGNGLGLSLVKKYCNLNGISIDVESKKGKGSKFTLLLTSKK